MFRFGHNTITYIKRTVVFLYRQEGVFFSYFKLLEKLRVLVRDIPFGYANHECTLVRTCLEKALTVSSYKI
jgi:hypothetical protein